MFTITVYCLIVFFVTVNNYFTSLFNNEHFILILEFVSKYVLNIYLPNGL